MRALLQRVRRASVSVDGGVIGEVGQGYLILLGVRQGDTKEEARFLAQKTAELRVFEDAEGKMNLSLLDVGGGALVVSQRRKAASGRGALSRLCLLFEGGRGRPRGYRKIRGRDACFD